MFQCTTTGSYRLIFDTMVLASATKGHSKKVDVFNFRCEIPHVMSCLLEANFKHYKFQEPDKPVTEHTKK